MGSGTPAFPANAPPRFASPRVRPWTPAGFDSLRNWAEAARVSFRGQTSDAIDSTTETPYGYVASIAGAWVRQLGRGHLGEVHAVESALDSLGFDTELVTDQQLQGFVLLVVRNPFRASARAMGFLMWFRGDRMFEQGLELRGGAEPQIRVWWTGNPEGPYEWAIIDRGRAGDPRYHFFMLRLTKDGGFWRPGQFDGSGPDFGAAYAAGFVDANGDGVPELMTWSEAGPDSLFEPAQSGPKRIIERIYTERKLDGFALSDTRLVPTCYSTFVRFVHLLVQHDPAAAQLLVDPGMIDEAKGLGWGSRRSPGIWQLELSEDEHWPEWLQFRFHGLRGTEHFVVRFVNQDGHWLITGWKRAATSVARQGVTR